MSSPGQGPGLLASVEESSTLWALHKLIIALITITPYCKSWFTHHGILGELITDNGQQVTRDSSWHFSFLYQLKHYCAHPSGSAGKLKQTAKTLIKETGQIPGLPVQQDENMAAPPQAPFGSTDAASWKQRITALSANV